MNKETPKFRNNTNSTKHTASLIDTKSLLSDHIKKHVKTARNPSPIIKTTNKTS